MAGDGTATAQGQTFFDQVLALVRERSGVDFRHYRPGTIGRRIANRMLSAGTGDERAYLALLERSRDEVWYLIERLTIKVSRFVRNRALFDFLRSEVAPRWRRRDAPVRLWCAGCARGEEAYSLALLLLRCQVPGDVLATDVDPGALSAAQLGCYRPEAFEELDADDKALCFDPEPDGAGRFRTTDAVRARVRFARHDLTAEAPPAGAFDLVSCRNVLIYLRPASQGMVTHRLLSALAPGGHLCLGESEWPPQDTLHRLKPISRVLRTFRYA